MATRPPEREIELHLTGNMEKFVWSLDGVTLNDSKPLHFRSGERLRLVMVNDSTMAHPMHLHGMWTEIEDPGGGFLARKHTVSIQPAQRVNWLVTADAPGRWAGPPTAPVTCFQPRLVRKRWSPLATMAVPSRRLIRCAGLTVDQCAKTAVST